MKRYSYTQVAKTLSEYNEEKERCEKVLDYLNYRSDLIEDEVSSLLMTPSEAQSEYQNMKDGYSPNSYMHLNKQKKEKKNHNYLACLVNIVAEKELGGVQFDDNPSDLTVITDDDDSISMTLSRRVDGAYPSTENASAIWEVKEYYYTTTFGSRVSDAVYVTLLDGYEINKAEEESNEEVDHYMFVDGKQCWWDDGRSYLCRLIDALNMQLVDEVFFGREVTSRWPKVVNSWD
jgi:hypothetical protein